MTKFKEGDEVLVRGVIDMLYREEDKAAIEVGQDSIWYIEELNQLIPASALDVNKELLEAAKAAIAYCEEISTFGSKYGTLEGPIVSAAYRIARGLNEAIASTEKGE